MALPKLTQPTFSCVLPSSGQKVMFRQFTVREEKILLTAQASDDKADMITAFKQLINNCSLTKLDIDNLPSVDIEYFFIQLRAKSVSNVVKLTFEDDVPDVDGVAQEPKRIEVQINLDTDVKVHKSQMKPSIVLDDQGVGVTLRYPTFDMMERISAAEGDETADTATDIIKETIVSIFDKDGVYPTADALPGEVDEFILSLNNQQSEMIQAFLDDMPYVYADVEYMNAKGVKVSTRVKGIESFFES